MNRNAITKDRLTRWKRRMNQHDATPLFLLGLSKDNKLVLCAPENYPTDEQLIEFLNAAAVLLKANRS